ncbi:phage tail protein [Exiguobacterium sp. A1_3_1]|uniref:phage tail protein n=1 Tax=Exiguobacterium sp. A1_3_1 TaxID=2651871 RepID=UPI003B98513E
MSYTAKTNWQGNDPVTESDLNRWEQGIKDSHEGLSKKIDATEKGIAGGVATLDENGKLKSGQIDIPSIPEGTTTTKGIVQLEESTTSTSVTKAATPKAVNEVNTKVGTLSALDTTEKTDLVVAINEVSSKANTKTSDIEVLFWMGAV